MTSQKNVPLQQASIRVFHGAGARGNIARCFIFATIPGADWQLKNATAIDETWCLLWREADIVQVIALKQGNEIRFCGHGLVAAGYFWLLTHGKAPVLLNRGRYYATRYAPDDGHFAVAISRTIVFSAINNELFAAVRDQHWFGQAPSICLSTGGDEDYLLCIWPPGVNIANLNINSELIGSQRRAVIMTQCDALTITSSDVQPFDLRYIAPQYGEDEGSATGSAAAIAADYWSRHFETAAGQRFVAHQRSPAGGEIHCVTGECSAERTCISEVMCVSDIWIGGRVMPVIDS